MEESTAIPADITPDRPADRPEDVAAQPEDESEDVVAEAEESSVD